MRYYPRGILSPMCLPFHHAPEKLKYSARFGRVNIYWSSKNSKNSKTLAQEGSLSKSVSKNVSFNLEFYRFHFISCSLFFLNALRITKCSGLETRGISFHGMCSLYCNSFMYIGLNKSGSAGSISFRILPNVIKLIL